MTNEPAKVYMIAATVILEVSENWVGRTTDKEVLDNLTDMSVKVKDGEYENLLYGTLMDPEIMEVLEEPWDEELNPPDDELEDGA